MSGFGYISTALSSGALWERLGGWLPETWRYRQGPVFVGKLNGLIGNTFLEGWGWKIPTHSGRVWDETQKKCIWQRLRDELAERRIKVVGVEADEEMIPLTGPGFPGVSDGKTLELLLFISDFSNILQKNRVMQNSEVLIVWEEGNLGLACARLVAREARFLTLVHPRRATLEQAAAIIMAETGISPKVWDILPPNLGNINIMIQCGRLTALKEVTSQNSALCVKLFQNSPDWRRLLPIAVDGRAGRLQSSSILAETLIRTAGGIDVEHWFGSVLMLERVFQLAGLLKKFGITVTRGNWEP